MSGSSDMRRLRAGDPLWDAFGETVGDGGRSADLRAYMEWRVNNPTTPLPGMKLGPVKKVRKKTRGGSPPP
jgi:hypothetical protein